MSNTIGPIKLFLVRTAAAACLTLLVSAEAAAQQPLASSPSTPRFISRSDVQLVAAALAHDDERFTWDTHLIADFDLVDYMHGRITLLADYQALLGEEFRPFDPYQSTYTLAVSASARHKKAELAGVFYHESRHLGDRPKRESIAMNVLAARVMCQVDLNGATLGIRGNLGRVINRSFVDYTWIGDLDVVARRPWRAHVGLFGRVFGELYGVDPAIAGRGLQKGGRIESGVRFSGPSGAVELFVGYENVIDADPLDRLPRRWTFGGFRLLRD